MRRYDFGDYGVIWAEVRGEFGGRGISARRAGRSRLTKERGAGAGNAFFYKKAIYRIWSEP